MKNKDLRSGPRHFLRLYLLERLLVTNLPKGSLILDAGSGGGEFSIRLAKRGFKAYAVDRDKKSCDILESRIRDDEFLKKGVIIENTSLENVDFSSNFFDGS